MRRRVAAPAAGQCLMDWLLDTLEHADAPTWRARIEAGQVTVDGARVDPGTSLRAGQRVAWAKPPWVEPVAPLRFGIVHEDPHLLVVEKPSGLPTLPGGGFQEHTLLALVRAHAPGASPMHRLGRGTSGLVLFCKSKEASRAVQAQWREPGAVHKRYLALASGQPCQDSFEVDVPIGLVSDPVMGQLYSASPTGKPSRSAFLVLERRADSCLLQVDIATGRPHQIRIHAAAAGHPLVGDPLYGSGGQRAPGSEARPGDLGYRLHAWRLGLTHPVGGRALAFVAPPPEELISGAAATPPRALGGPSS